MNDERVCTTADLTQMIRKADRRGANQRAASGTADLLDPQGVHLIMMAVPLIDDGAYHRVRVMAAVKETEEPATFLLDIELKDYDRLTLASDLLAASGMTEEEP